MAQLTSIDDILGKNYFDKGPIRKPRSESNTPKAEASKPADPPARKERPRSTRRNGSEASAEPVPVPVGLLKKQTVSAITKGQYQKKLLAHYAPPSIVGFLEGLRQGCLVRDPKCLQLTAEIYDMIPNHKKGGISVNVQQNNANQGAGALIAPGGRGAFKSPDEMFRQLAAEKEQRALGPAPMEFTILPEETSKAEPLIDTRED